VGTVISFAELLEMPPPHNCHSVDWEGVYFWTFGQTLSISERGTGPSQGACATLHMAASTGTVGDFFLPLLQALSSSGLQHLQLSESFAGGSFTALAALLPPSLVAEIIDAHFTAPLSLQSLDTVYSCPNSKFAGATIAVALPLLCERLPALTRLTLRPDSASASCSRSRHATSSGRPDPSGPPLCVLAALSSLQQLHICGSVMVAGVAASLPLLPALTRLQLGGMMPPEHASILASLSGLLCLHLPWYNQWNDKNWTAATLAAMKQLRGITELVLDSPEGPMQCSEPLALLKPLPGTLRRLVVAHEESVEEAMRVFGGGLDEIRAMGQ
jgi:hypothetical protein